MSESDLTTYSDMADVIERMPQTFRDARRARGVGLREVSDATSISLSSLSRFENNLLHLSTSGVVALLRWLDQTSPAHTEGTADHA